MNSSLFAHYDGELNGDCPHHRVQYSHAHIHTSFYVWLIWSTIFDIWICLCHAACALNSLSLLPSHSMDSAIIFFTTHNQRHSEILFWFCRKNECVTVPLFRTCWMCKWNGPWSRPLCRFRWWCLNILTSMALDTQWTSHKCQVQWCGLFRHWPMGCGVVVRRGDSINRFTWIGFVKLLLFHVTNAQRVQFDM